MDGRPPLRDDDHGRTARSGHAGHVSFPLNPREGRAASIDLDGEVIAGALPGRALLLVTEWAQMHREELEANWERARREEPLQPIDPLP